MEKGTFAREKDELGLIYSNKAELGAKFKLFTSAEISGDVIRRGRIFEKLRT